MHNYSPAWRWASPIASTSQWTLTFFTSCSLYSRPTMFCCFPKYLCSKQCPKIKAFDYYYSKESFEHYIQIPATWSAKRPNTNPTNFLTSFLGFRNSSQTIGRNHKGKELSRNNFIHLSIPIYFSLWQIPSPGVWDTDTILWKLISLRLVFDTAKPDLTMLPKTPILNIIVLCTAHTIMAITSLFSFTHMVWTLLLEITPQLCSPYSPATTMIYWCGRSPKRFTSQSAINSTPRIGGLSPSHPPGRYPLEGLPENHY